MLEIYIHARDPPNIQPIVLTWSVDLCTLEVHQYAVLYNCSVDPIHYHILANCSVDLSMFDYQTSHFLESGFTLNTNRYHILYHPYLDPSALDIHQISHSLVPSGSLIRSRYPRNITLSSAIR